MRKNKCITFDKEVQNNLPKWVKDKMQKDRKKAEAEQLNLNGVIKILEEIKEYQMQNVQLARTTEVYKLAEKAIEAIIVTHSSSQLPDELEPVLAKIEHINSLGTSSYWEVVYYDGNWQSYQGSKTFEDGEKVVNWKYCKAII